MQRNMASIFGNHIIYYDSVFQTVVQVVQVELKKLFFFSGATMLNINLTFNFMGIILSPATSPL